MAHIMPALVCTLVYKHGAWIVGSAAAPDADLANVADFDVLVPYSRWTAAAGVLPRTARVNTFGGWKCVSEDRHVDIWPDDLEAFMLLPGARWAWHPKTGVRLSKHNDQTK